MSRRQIIDFFLGKYLSRKLLVFIIATLLCLFGDLTSNDWVTVAIVYISSQAVVDSMSKLKSKNNI